MSTLDNLFQALLRRRDLNPDERAKLEKISGRWEEGIIPAPSAVEWARKLLDSRLEVRACKHLKDKTCFHHNRRDPIHGAVPCDFLEEQKNCNLYMKGEI